MELLLLILLGVVALYWYAGMRSKEIAVKSARAKCHQFDVQLLDQTVQQTRISLSRDEIGSWKVWRQYRFEYTKTGDDRERGRVIVLGNKVITVELQKIYPVIH